MRLSDLKPHEFEVHGEDKPLSLSSLHPDDVQFEGVDKPSKVESALRGAAQGLSFGWADELTGALEAAKDKILGSARDKAFSDLYEKHRDESRSKYHRAQEENPATYTAGEIGGGLATSMMPLGSAATLGKTLVTGAALGGAAGLGGSEANSVTDQAIDAAKGAALGGAIGGAAYGVGRGLSKAGVKLKDLAETKAFESLGGGKAATSEALAKGKLQDTGRFLLDEGVVTPLASKETMADRLQSITNDRMGKLNDILEKVSRGEGLTPEQTQILEGAKFNPKKAGEALKSRIAEKYSELPESVVNGRQQMVDEWLSSPNPMDIKQAQKFKTQMNDFIRDSSYWKQNPNASQDTLVGVRRALKEGIENNANSYQQALGNQGGSVKSINQDLGKALEASDIVDDRIARDIANQSFSLGDKVVGAAGAANQEGGPGLIRGLVMGGANKFLRHRGDQLVATGADKVSKFLLQSPRFQKLATDNPKAFRAMVADFGRRMSTQKPLPLSAGNDLIDPEIAKQQFLEGN